ncbi:MAG: hypothetical protein D6B27_09040 [Gammaproteobacteria bacterium]|nr:MAG: hypothetical protein D6B27_09040 [Gammaproteobacteria bacterium]
MLKKDLNQNGRVVFLDNIRYLIVLLVVVLHVAVAYSGMMPHWPVNDNNSVLFDIFLGICDISLMPAMFFIAGYFVLKSIRKTGASRFILSKVIRLGIPWLVGVILFQPIHCYIYYSSRGMNGVDIWAIVFRELKTALSVHVGFASSPVEFNHYHFWFISLLLLFCIVFALCYKLKHLFFKCSKSTNNRILLSFSMLCILTIIAVVIMLKVITLTLGDKYTLGWLKITPILQFQPIKLPIYIASFSLGTYACSKEWFTDGYCPGHPFLWGVFSIMLFVINLFLYMSLLKEYSLLLASVLACVRIIMVYTVLLLLISFGVRYWNKASYIGKSLTENSYNIYLVHMVFALVIPFLLLNLDISIYLKFLIGTSLSIILSYIVSRYLIKTGLNLFLGSMGACSLIATAPNDSVIKRLRKS